MATVVSLCEFRKQRLGSQWDEDIPRPRISDGHIWGRDYGSRKQMLYGLLMVRDILNFHLHHEEEWKHYLLTILDALIRRKPDASELVGSYLGRLMNYLALVFDQDNRQDLGAAILILDLMHKARERALAV